MRFHWMAASAIVFPFLCSAQVPGDELNPKTKLDIKPGKDDVKGAYVITKCNSPGSPIHAALLKDLDKNDTEWIILGKDWLWSQSYAIHSTDKAFQDQAEKMISQAKLNKNQTEKYWAKVKERDPLVLSNIFLGLLENQRLKGGLAYRPETNWFWSSITNDTLSTCDRRKLECRETAQTGPQRESQILKGELLKNKLKLFLRAFDENHLLEFCASVEKKSDPLFAEFPKKVAECARSENANSLWKSLEEYCASIKSAVADLKKATN